MRPKKAGQKLPAFFYSMNHKLIKQCDKDDQESHLGRSSALKREAQIKKWSRTWKLILINL
jgi:hypothetical protein